MEESTERAESNRQRQKRQAPSKPAPLHDFESVRAQSSLSCGRGLSRDRHANADDDDADAQPVQKVQPLAEERRANQWHDDEGQGDEGYGPAERHAGQREHPQKRRRAVNEKGGPEVRAGEQRAEKSGQRMRDRRVRCFLE